MKYTTTILTAALGTTLVSAGVLPPTVPAGNHPSGSRLLAKRVPGTSAPGTRKLVVSNPDNEEGTKPPSWQPAQPPPPPQSPQLVTLWTPKKPEQQPPQPPVAGSSTGTGTIEGENARKLEKSQGQVHDIIGPPPPEKPQTPPAEQKPAAEKEPEKPAETDEQMAERLQQEEWDSWKQTPEYEVWKQGQQQ
ncbi:hypothetical protein QBC35DRAFT_465382 [Podospora australis]|uniref:Uncharacterized protein n=1 Tax=Podospora australis TaxID=1536484 RepID=A0AAN6WPH8_9PEZI|nr:hypothetical protein QBC35DRAFT_465382 [Podospora australis]